MIVQDEVPEGEEENDDARDYDGPEADVLVDGETSRSDKPRKTTKYMTKYERARVLGTRALQIRCEHLQSCKRLVYRCVEVLNYSISHRTLGSKKCLGIEL